MRTADTARAWDAYDAYLFDIDGTLLACTDAVHYFAFCAVLEWLAGRPLNLDGVTAHGNTDVGILRDAMLLAGVPEEVWRRQLPEAKAALCNYVKERKREICAQALPGVTAVLNHLQLQGSLLGVATGNLEGIGRLKLEHCDLLRYFAFGAYSDAHEHRKDVFRAGLEQARVLAGPAASVCVVGDTPADIEAAHGNGLDVIAVATGVYPFERLAAACPEWCVHSLAELPIPG